MTAYKRGDIVLINYFFSDDLSKTKKRPGLIVQADGIVVHEGNYLIAQFTTANWEGPTRIKVLERSTGWNKMGLISTSVLVLDVIQTFHDSLILKKLGFYPHMPQVDLVLKTVFGLD